MKYTPKERCNIEKYAKWQPLLLSENSEKKDLILTKAVCEHLPKKHQDKLKLADPLGVKLLSHLRLDFSHLNQHNLGHCGAEVKTTQYFFLH